MHHELNMQFVQSAGLACSGSFAQKSLLQLEGDEAGRSAGKNSSAGIFTTTFEIYSQSPACSFQTEMH